MEAEITADPEQQLVLIRMTGTITSPEVFALIDEQANRGRWSWATLYDQRQAHQAVTSADIMRIADHVEALSRKHGQRGPVAVVIGADVDYGVNRIYGAYANGRGYVVEVFRALAEAYAWLGREAR